MQTQLPVRLNLVDKQNIVTITNCHTVYVHDMNSQRNYSSHIKTEHDVLFFFYCYLMVSSNGVTKQGALGVYAPPVPVRKIRNFFLA